VKEDLGVLRGEEESHGGERKNIRMEKKKEIRKKMYRLAVNYVRGGDGRGLL